MEVVVDDVDFRVVRFPCQCGDAMHSFDIVKEPSMRYMCINMQYCDMGFWKRILTAFKLIFNPHALAQWSEIYLRDQDRSQIANEIF